VSDDESRDPDFWVVWDHGCDGEHVLGTYLEEIDALRHAVGRLGAKVSEVCEGELLDQLT
jgi:hypothetical protein